MSTWGVTSGGANKVSAATLCNDQSVTRHDSKYEKLIDGKQQFCNLGRNHAGWPRLDTKMRSLCRTPWRARSGSSTSNAGGPITLPGSLRVEASGEGPIPTIVNRELPRNVGICRISSKRQTGGFLADGIGESPCRTTLAEFGRGCSDCLFCMEVSTNPASKTWQGIAPRAASGSGRVAGSGGHRFVGSNFQEAPNNTASSVTTGACGSRSVRSATRKNIITHRTGRTTHRFWPHLRAQHSAPDQREKIVCTA